MKWIVVFSGSVGITKDTYFSPLVSACPLPPHYIPSHGHSLKPNFMKLEIIFKKQKKCSRTLKLGFFFNGEEIKYEYQITENDNLKTKHV